jgi:NADH:ubiquinone oxidoreductase subunit 6 (subunit J)
MPLHATQLSFWLLTVMVLVSSAGAAFARNIIQAAYCLFFTLVGMAGYYVLLGSDFLAITQVIIYVGGILVLLMFGILLTNRPLAQARKGTLGLCIAGGVAGAAFLLLVLLPVIASGGWKTALSPAPPESNLRIVGWLLFGQYLAPFEMAGMTLLLCLVGAAYLVRRRER